MNKTQQIKRPIMSSFTRRALALTKVFNFNTSITLNELFYIVNILKKRISALQMCWYSNIK